MSDPFPNNSLQGNQPVLAKQGGARQNRATTVFQRFLTEWASLSPKEMEVVKSKIQVLLGFSPLIQQTPASPVPKAQEERDSTLSKHRASNVAEKSLTNLNKIWHETDEFKAFKELQKQVQDAKKKTGEVPKELLTLYKNSYSLAKGRREAFLGKDSSKASTTSSSSKGNPKEDEKKKSDPTHRNNESDKTESSSSSSSGSETGKAKPPPQGGAKPIPFHNQGKKK